MIRNSLQKTALFSLVYCLIAILLCGNGGFAKEVNFLNYLITEKLEDFYLSVDGVASEESDHLSSLEDLYIFSFAYWYQTRNDKTETSKVFGELIGDLVVKHRNKVSEKGIKLPSVLQVLKNFRNPKGELDEKNIRVWINHIKFPINKNDMIDKKSYLKLISQFEDDFLKPLLK